MRYNPSLIRIPWMLLNARDPSQKEFIGDLWAKNGIEASMTIDRLDIGASLATDNRVVDSFQGNERYEWEVWDIPQYEEKLKQSYKTIEQLLSSIVIRKLPTIFNTDDDLVIFIMQPDDNTAPVRRELDSMTSRGKIDPLPVSYFQYLQFNPSFGSVDHYIDLVEPVIHHFVPLILPLSFE